MKKIAKTTNLNESTFAMYNGAGDPTLTGTQHNVQGSFPGYVYSVLGFNDTLQQKKNKPSTEYYIHPGCTVSGVGFNNPNKRYTGLVNRIFKDESGNIICLYVQAFSVEDLRKPNKEPKSTSEIVTVRVDDNLELKISKSEEQKGLHTTAPSYTTNITR